MKEQSVAIFTHSARRKAPVFSRRFCCCALAFFFAAVVMPRIPVVMADGTFVPQGQGEGGNGAVGTSGMGPVR